MNEEGLRALEANARAKKPSHFRDGLCLFLTVLAFVLAAVNVSLVAEYVQLKRVHISKLQELGDAAANDWARVAHCKCSVSNDKSLSTIARANADSSSPWHARTRYVGGDDVVCVWRGLVPRAPTTIHRGSGSTVWFVEGHAVALQEKNKDVSEKFNLASLPKYPTTMGHNHYWNVYTHVHNLQS